jgi:hypothetical protein
VHDRAHAGLIANVAFEWLPAIRAWCAYRASSRAPSVGSPQPKAGAQQPARYDAWVPRTTIRRTSTPRVADATTGTTAEGAPTTEDEATPDVTERGVTMTQGGMERGTTTRRRVVSRRKSRGPAGRAFHLAVRVDPPRGQSRLAIHGAGPTDRSVGTIRARPCIPASSILCRKNEGLRSRGPA